MKNKISNIIKIIRQNQKYIWIFLAFFSFFLINKSFPAEVITSQSCANEKCAVAVDNPNLTDQKPKYYIDDMLQSKENEYYRLFFQTKSNQTTSLEVYTTLPLSKDKFIGKVNISEANADIVQELIFKTDGRYSDLLFKKADANDHSEIIISEARITKLDVSNEASLKELKNTIFSNPKSYFLTQSQEKSDHSFNQLIEPKIIVGEVFRNDVDFITEVELDLDIIKQGDGGGENFKLVLREADFDGITPEISSRALVELKFSFKGMGVYRQKNGKFKFPIFSRVTREKYYFIGINNDRVAVNKFNHILIRGTKDSSSYIDGTTAVKKDRETYPIFGDIYFKIYGLIFDEYENERVLSGTTIEDIGNKKGIFKFEPVTNRVALLDLFEYSENIDFSNDKKIIYGNIDPNKNNYYSYKFETYYPINKVNLKATKSDLGWSDVNLEYSTDNRNWQEIPFESTESYDLTDPTEMNRIQNYNFSLSEKFDKKIFYIKITPKYLTKKNFGLDKLDIIAELDIK